MIPPLVCLEFLGSMLYVVCTVHSLMSDTQLHIFDETLFAVVIACVTLPF